MQLKQTKVEMDTNEGKESPFDPFVRECKFWKETSPAEWREGQSSYKECGTGRKNIKSC